MVPKSLSNFEWALRNSLFFQHENKKGKYFKNIELSCNIRKLKIQQFPFSSDENDEECSIILPTRVNKIEIANTLKTTRIRNFIMRTGSDFSNNSFPDANRPHFMPIYIHRHWTLIDDIIRNSSNFHDK